MRLRAVLLALAVGSFAVSADSQTPVGAGFERLLEKNKKQVTLKPADYDHVFLVATWCPYSKELVRILNAKFDAGALPDTRIAFIVTDEWDKYEEAAPDNGWSASDLKQIRKQLQKEQTHPVLLVEAEAITTYPGDVFFYPGPAAALKDIGYPSVYVRQLDSFSAHGGAALQMLGVSEEEMAAFYE